MKREQSAIGEFLVAHGGPYYELQRRAGLLRADALHSRRRALIFVALTWGVPLLLCLFAGTAYGAPSTKPFLLDMNAWSRYLIAVGLFILMERVVEDHLKAHLQQFARAPLLAPECLDAAARSVVKALDRRDSATAEAICLVIAMVATVVSSLNALDAGTSSWAISTSATGHMPTAAGWWAVLVSVPVFWFLLLRWLWRQFIWGMLLRDLAKLELRLVATHPDGHGGLGFIGQYPNTFSGFVFALSCVIAAAIGHRLLDNELSATTLTYVMGTWLLIVIALFAFPLLAFWKSLTVLKRQSLLTYGAQATLQRRAAERELLGRNILAPEREAKTGEEIADPSKGFEAARKLSSLLVGRSALVPLGAAALIPLVVAGATQVPIKELFGIAKKLLLL